MARFFDPSLRDYWEDRRKRRLVVEVGTSIASNCGDRRPGRIAEHLREGAVARAEPRRVADRGDDALISKLGQQGGACLLPS
jgi:hypothetical protein